MFRLENLRVGTSLGRVIGRGLNPLNLTLIFLQIFLENITIRRHSGWHMGVCPGRVPLN